VKPNNELLKLRITAVWEELHTSQIAVLFLAGSGSLIENHRLSRKLHKEKLVGWAEERSPTT
jgi:hypothetical protein